MRGGVFFLAICAACSSGTPDAPADGAGSPRDAPAPFSDPYGGRLLGANVAGPGLVEFSLFAPRAATVAAVVNGQATPLAKDGDGVFSGLVAAAPGDRYRFLLDGEVSAADPYAKANLQHDGDSLVVDPPRAPAFARPPRDALVIYEMQLSDFTYSETSGVPAEHRGRYAGVAGRLDHLQRLGVNAVEMMPLSESQSDDYSWGYNPALLFAPEAAYASRPDGAQVAELRATVDALHEAGIAVLVDTVFNHVAGRDGDNPFWDVDRLYYFDVDDDGDPEDDRLAWGYHLATSRPMVKKLMFDVLRYWMDVYGVDGFRLDATQFVDIDAILEVIDRLRAAGYGDRIFVFEEFDAGHNARIRAANASAGAPVVSSWANGLRDPLWSALQNGQANDRSLGVGTYYSKDHGWGRPGEVVNYFSSHDEGTLTARFGASEAQVRVAAVHLMTSLGVPMFWMGEEFARLHYGNHHPDGGRAGLERENNTVDWTLAADHAELIDFFAALVHLRLAHPALRPADDPGAHFQWATVRWPSSIGWIVRDVPGDHDFVVLVNYESAPVVYDVRFPSAGGWHLLCDGTRAVAEAPGLSTIEVGADPQAVTVPARAGLIYMRAALNP